MPVNLPANGEERRERRGEEKREKERESVRANSSFILPSFRLFPPLVALPRAIYFPSLDRDLLLDGTHTKIRGNGRRASEREGKSRASVRISANSRSFSCLLSSHSPPTSRPTSINRERGHKAYA